MDPYTEPVVKSKPIRVREMITKAVPTDFLEIHSIKTDGENLTQQLQKPAELYHEGYVQGKLYMVPDSNLEAMKDIINFKMRPRRSVRYKHQTSFELSDYDQCRSKLNALLDKIDKISKYSDDIYDRKGKPTLESTLAEEGKEIHKHKEISEEELKTEGEPKKCHVKELESQCEKEKLGEASIGKPVEPDITPETITESEEYIRVRLLISGHFTEGRKPTYIVQQYAGEPNIFENQETDISSKINGDGHNINILGKFYNENILEESEGKPVALNIKQQKILINEETSQVYGESFNNVFKVDNIDVSLKGEFIKSEITNDITPYLTVEVIKHQQFDNSDKSQLKIDQNEAQTNGMHQASTTILFYRSDDKNTESELNLYKEMDFDSTLVESNDVSSLSVHISPEEHIARQYPNETEHPHVHYNI